MPSRRSLQFCRALHQEIGDDSKRWTTITAVADRVGGGHSVTLGPEGWQLVRKRLRQQRV
jgi:hypothetical protein